MASETTFAMRKKKSEGEGSLVLKLDMAKPYDRVEWWNNLVFTHSNFRTNSKYIKS